MRLGCAFAIQNAEIVELDTKICHLIFPALHGTTVNCQKIGAWIA